MSDSLSDVEAQNSTTHPIVRGLRERPWFCVLCVVALIYALLAGLRTVSEYDVFWQLATGRCVLHNHKVFSTDVFSYMAQGQPWIYPVGSGLLFYLAFLLGGYTLISWLGSVACAGTVALLLRRGTTPTAALAIIAVPAIAPRTAPRADMFTVVFFAAFLSILWEQYEIGTGKMWLLPLFMVVWVNLHLGFVAGLGLGCGYLVLETARLFNEKERQGAKEKLKADVPWIVTTYFATLINPWGWGIYQALFRQAVSMGVHSERIVEWAGVSFTMETLRQALGFRDPGSAAEWLLVGAVVAVVIAAIRRQWSAALFLAASLWMTLRHVRFFALFACIVVVVGGSVLFSVLGAFQARFRDQRLISILTFGVASVFLLLASIRSFDLITDRLYLGGDGRETFGTGLSWWFPERAMEFIEREQLPSQIFNGYEVGGFLIWRLWPKYLDYADGRAIPFGQNLFSHLQELLQSPPDSPQWLQEADAHGINTILLSVARRDGLKFTGGVLPYFCGSKEWRPVYVDEVSAIFVRLRPETQALIKRFPVDCSSTPLPTNELRSLRTKGERFNRWANSAALLLALQRNEEAKTASTQALSIYRDSAELWYVRGRANVLTGHPEEAEKDLLQSAALQPNRATWSELAELYLDQRRYPQAINALQQLAEISPDQFAVILQLGYAYLHSGLPRKALQAFDRAERELPTGDGNAPPLAELNNGRAIAWSMLDDIGKAIQLEEEAVRLAPQAAAYWKQLAQYYEREGRLDEAQNAMRKALMLNSSRPH